MSGIQFWRLNSPGSTSKLAEWIHDEMELEQIICPINKGHQRGGKRLTDLSVTLPSGTVQDFVWTWQNECLLQDHVLELLQANGLTGFEVKPVKAKFRYALNRKPPRMWELVVTGWAGMASPESGIRLVERCDGCGHIRYSGCTDPGKIVDLSQWNGNDFFIVWPLPKFIFVTDRLVRVIRDNRLTGVNLMLPNTLDLSSGFSPGRLSYWMPEQRAHEIGEALGIE